ncbi:uncharacterized protein I303_106942 [Kwoniella dejecticola CBS 10117]|uniref:Xaa-Pro dipeptidyl-peptidase C-terminal domain-containing protein n=1 Tax=Kwoniella dejecticola CBS 10117 TaxID=1296121 RepID=A0A1A5ZT93_9TREE|nr:uncharacterized protein I303_08419 [Kwoniella dejecticola CBS 10117]OBR81037.1 hypothetical protein I303_08419 [Kwoniella dejecticola CBS 10117]
MPPPCQIAHRPIRKPEVGRQGYQGFNPRTEYLKKGDRPYGARAVDCDITAEHDVEVMVRDGCRLYVDIFRPTNASGPVPAILAYSPFGKKFSGLCFLNESTKNIAYRLGVTLEDVSGLEKFESLDPSHWCGRGYAIVNVDGRGAGDSDGGMAIMGTQEGEDGYDVIENIAKRDWCNGNIGLAGNSHLGIVQWFIAQQQPPSLKAIAPWEACSDLYREQFVRGGIFNLSNFDFIANTILQGKVGVEDFAEMYRRTDEGKMNAYWADKRANLKSIKIPAYITGSEFSGIHGMGSLRGYMELDTKDKWFRWCGTQEWYDIWADKESNDDLQGFFDTFLKGEDNGWRERTPKVRVTVLQFGRKEPINDIIVPDFPIPNTDYKDLYLNADSKLSLSAPAAGTISYDSQDPGSKVSFTYTFDKQTRLIGLPKAVLYMSCADHDDLSVSVQLKKLDPTGKPLKHLTIPFGKTPIDDPEDCKPVSMLLVHGGTTGFLRASHRHIDEAKSIHPQYPYHTHDRVEKVPPGTVVELQVGIWAMGVQFEAGEALRMDVSATNPLWLELSDGALLEGNKGVHTIHLGGEHASRLILPFVDV